MNRIFQPSQGQPSNKLSLGALNENKIEIALFSETLPNYNHTFFIVIYRHDRMDRSGGGVAISVRKNVQHELLPRIKTKLIETIAIKVKGPTYNLVFIAAYFPGTKQELFRHSISNQHPL